MLRREPNHHLRGLQHYKLWFEAKYKKIGQKDKCTRLYCFSEEKNNPLKH